MPLGLRWRLTLLVLPPNASITRGINNFRLSIRRAHQIHRSRTSRTSRTTTRSLCNTLSTLLNTHPSSTPKPPHKWHIRPHSHHTKCTLLSSHMHHLRRPSTRQVCRDGGTRRLAVMRGRKIHRPEQPPSSSSSTHTRISSTRKQHGPQKLNRRPHNQPGQLNNPNHRSQCRRSSIPGRRRVVRNNPTPST